MFRNFGESFKTTRIMRKSFLFLSDGFELPVRHSYSLKHSKFTAAGKNTSHHGVEEI